MRTDDYTKFALDFQQWLFDLMANDEYVLTIGGELNEVYAQLAWRPGGGEVGAVMAEVYDVETPTDAMKELMRLYPAHQ